MWIVIHLETSKEIFNNFWWFNIRPLELVLTEDGMIWMKRHG
jgi:hypothetical protein